MAFKVKILRLRFFIILLFTLSAFAQDDLASSEKAENVKKITGSKPKLKSRPKDSGQNAKIKVDGSAVYEAPNFDSPVLEYMDSGKTVKISKKVYPGIGGLGAFYKIRLNKGVYGFIADTDVQASSKKNARKNDTDEGDKKLEDEVNPLQLQPSFENDNVEPEVPDSLYFTHYLGLSYYSYNYAEKINGEIKTSAVSMFGVKRSGPTDMFGGMPLDLNLLFTPTAPGFYDSISSSTSGYMIIGDALIMIPLYESKLSLVYYGLGVMLRHSAWEVKLRNQGGLISNIKETGFGLAGELGAATHIGQKMVLRVDGKYYYEKEKYFSYGVALQFRY